MKAQSSIEQLVVTGLGIAFLAVVFVIAINLANDNTRVSQAQDAVNKLAKAADYVYALGPGSKDKVYVYIPEGLVSVNVSTSTISMRVSLSSGEADVFANTNSPLLGSIPDVSGPQEISITYLEGGSVFFGDTYLSCSPSSITKSFAQGGSGNDSVTLTNIGDRTITNISTSISGNLADLLTLAQPEASLGAGSSDSVGLEFSVGVGKTPGTYSGSVRVNGSDNSRCDSSITVFVTAVGGEDASGPVVSDVNHTPSSPGTSDPITITALGSDSSTGGNTISHCEIDLDYSAVWNSMSASDGAFEEVTEDLTYSLGTLGEGSHTVRLKCTDSLANTGPATPYTFMVGSNGTGVEDGSGPVVMGMYHTSYPTAFSNISAGGIGNDEYTGNSTIKGCNVKVDSGSWNPATPDDGAWNSVSENFSYSVGPLPVGSHVLYYQCTDSLDNIGSIFQDSFMVVDVDLMLVLDKSGSMSSYVTYASNSNTVSTSSASWTWVKNLTVTQKNGDMANLSVETKASSSGCTVSYNATISGVTAATGSRTSTSYGTSTASINVSDYTVPYTVSLWLKRSSSGCTAYNRNMYLWQQPTKMNAVKTASKNFLDIAGSNIQAGLVSYSTSATTDRTLAEMNPANQQALKNAIDALTPGGITCIQCGLENGATELVSARARPGATKVIILLSDGQANSGDSITGAVYCRDRNVTVYTIGFGYDVDETELTNIAMLTNGEYYFAPDVATLTEIFNSLGRVVKSVSD